MNRELLSALGFHQGEHDDRSYFGMLGNCTYTIRYDPAKDEYRIFENGLVSTAIDNAHDLIQAVFELGRLQGQRDLAGQLRALLHIHNK